MKWGRMSSPTPSVDSLTGGSTLGSFVESGGDSGLGLELSNGCHGSSSSSSTCSSIIFPHLSISNGILTNGHSPPHPPEFNSLSDVQFSRMSTKCGICHETFSRPKVLPCLHTFCQDCLEKVSDLSDRIICPSCRHDCPLSSQGVSGLLSDFGMSSLIDSDSSGWTPESDLNSNITLTQNNKSCTGCKSTESFAVARCYDCSDYLCSNCVMAHQFMHCFEGHRVINIASENGLMSSKEVDKSVSCTQHKGEILQFYCRSCAVPACGECISLDHPKSIHDVEILAECEAKYVNHLSQYIHDFRVKSLDLSDVLKSFETASSRLQSQYMKAQNEVSEAFAFYRSLLDERKSELSKELENLYSTRQVTLSVVTQRLSETLERMYQTVEFGDRLLRHASPPQVLLFKKLLESRLQALLSAVPEPTLAMAAAAAGDFEFVANFSAIQSAVRNTLGYIRSGGSSGGGGSNGNNETILNGTSGSKQPPAPIARPIPSSLNNNYSSSSLLLSSSSSTTLDSSSFPPHSGLDLPQMTPFDKWTSPSDLPYQNGHKDFSVPDYMSSAASISSSDPLLDLSSKLLSFPKSPSIKRQKMIYHCKFGEFGTSEAQFTEPSGVTVNSNSEIIVADTNNHRIQIFDRDGRFKFQFGECGKRDGQLLYPNRVAVVRPSGDIVVTERSPTHQIQIYNQYGQFVRKFGANILQHPRGVTVDSKGRIIVVECKVMRVIIFDQMGTVLHKFGCSKHLEFPNGVVVNERQEIFISDNRAHCVKVFSYEGVFLRQIGGEGLTNYPIGVGINGNGEILVADNHNNFNLTIFTQDGQLVSALESKVKHAQCFDVALMDDGSVVLASKDYRLYIYRYVQVPPIGL